MMDYPILIFAISLAALCLSALAGARLSKTRGKLDEDDRADFNVILTAALTLLGLIIGFTFSMAVTRYNQRNNYEASEANAIGTECVRAELMHSAEAAKTRELLRRYLNQRIAFYRTSDAALMERINASTAGLQRELWSAVREGTAAEQTPVAALILSGMNDVSTAQGNVRGAWWSHIPNAAWILMMTIAICCNGLMGYTARRPDEKSKRLFVLPLLLSITFFLIADIDNPAGVVVRIHPRDLLDLAQSVATP